MQKSQEEGNRQKNIALVLIFFQILGFFVLFPSFIQIEAMLRSGVNVFEMDPLRVIGPGGLPLLFIGSVVAGWMLFRRKKNWLAIAVSALPLLVFAVQVMVWG